MTPIHPATEALKAQRIRDWVEQACRWAPNAIEGLPAELRGPPALRRRRRRDPRRPFPRERRGRPRPPSRGVAFEELFLYQAMLATRKRTHRTARPAPRSASPGEPVGRWLESLPFEPTGDQLAAFDEIDADLDSGEPMQRLLMGEVGSGKTVVAVYSMLRALEAGYQAVLMAPTETLAEQHALTLDRLLGARGDPVRAADRGDAGADPQARPEPARQRRAGTDPGHPRADRADGAVRAARPLRRRRAAPLRGRAAPRARLQGGGGDGAARPPHDRDADPAHALADRLRRPRHDRPARAAGRSQAGRDLAGRGGAPGRGLRVHPRPPARGPPGLRRLPAGRRVREDAGQGGGGRGRAPAAPASCATSRSASCTARCPRPRRPRRCAPSPPARPTCWWRRR